MSPTLRPTIVALAAAAFLGGTARAGAGAAPAPSLASRLHLAPCVGGPMKTEAQCGTLDVYEDRTTQRGRTIPLRLVVIRATKPSGHAIFYNPGGPGASAVDQAPQFFDGLYGNPFAELRDRYDLVLVDVRGTGRSAPLDCALYPRSHPAPSFAQIWPDAALRACRIASAKKADLDQYTTDITADDLDDVRAALHEDRVVLYGGSYGTMLYLDYVRRHPQHVESAVLEGVTPPGFFVIPREYAQGAQAALDRVIADCAAERACRAHFPALRAHATALLHRFDRGPLRIRIRNLATKRYEMVALSKEVFADRLRQAMYSSQGAAQVPLVLERAYGGDAVPLGTLIQQVTQGFAGVSTGLNLSVTCAEDVPFITEADIARTSAGTFMGDTRVRAQQHACAIWNVQPVSRAFVQPVRSNAPILMVSGADDPASPPQFGRAALRYLPSARQLVVPHASHELDLPCADRLIVDFVRARSAKKLRTASCAASSRRPPFVTDPKALL